MSTSCNSCKSSKCSCKGGIELLSNIINSGQDGVSITNVVLNPNNTLTFFYSNGTSTTTSAIATGVANGLSYVLDHYYGIVPYTQHDILVPAGLLSENGDVLKIHCKLNSLDPQDRQSQFVSLLINDETSPGTPTETTLLDSYPQGTTNFLGIIFSAESHIDLSYELTRITNISWMIKRKAFINFGSGQKIHQQEIFRIPSSGIPFATLNMETNNNTLSLLAFDCNINFVNVEVIKNIQ